MIVLYGIQCILVGISHGKSEGRVVHAVVNYCVCNEYGSAHSCVFMVDGSFARAAISIHDCVICV